MRCAQTHQLSDYVDRRALVLRDGIRADLCFERIVNKNLLIQADGDHGENVYPVIREG